MESGERVGPKKPSSSISGERCTPVRLNETNARACALARTSASAFTCGQGIGHESAIARDGPSSRRLVATWSRRVLRKLLAGGESKEQELDVAFVGECLAQDASGWDGRLSRQIGEESVGLGDVSTRCGLPERG